MTNKCVVVKLKGAEVSDLSEPMREALRSGAYSIVNLIALYIEDGIKDGSITVKDNSINRTNIVSIMAWCQFIL